MKEVYTVWKEGWKDGKKEGWKEGWTEGSIKQGRKYV